MRLRRGPGVRGLAAVLSWTMVLPGGAAAPAKESAAGRPDSSAPWKIDAPHGPSQTVSFTTDEGTWLHLDVSPDGHEIVFALLGDLYVLPITGGEAKRITSGAAYDVQPRFSPDGKWIAFASDRGGLENLWICDREGQQTRQISTDKDSTVNAPSWSPDGDYLIGRKRLTDTSSLGTVELWLWHVKGGAGLQITKKDDQPDAADPVFSPDGRFVYFSARGARYRYNRNVNEGIWQIKRLDRHTGQTVELTGEFGGAATPILTRDGKTMAFVRRVRAKTRIELMDLASGRTRLLADDVERDNQEGFAFHGVFPGYAFTPDGQAVIATAQGKLWRFAVADGARTPLPFNAAVEQRVTDAVRQPHSVWSDSVRARVVRWPVESPDGHYLVFSAAGHLYGMNLFKGTPERLTSSDDFEYAPAFSPDGRELVYVSWNDEQGGAVWRLPLAPGARPQKLTEDAGQYVNPAFSPDGSKIVYVKGSGATLRDENLDDELWHELYWVPSAGGARQYVIGTKNRGTNRREARPQFSKDGTRILFLEDADAKPTEVPKAVLVSVRLDGTDRREHLRWPKAQEAMVSPDGRWVAYVEQHNAWVTALPEKNDVVDVAAEGALPAAQLTDDGGEWIGWADGGRTLTWSFGPVYHRLALDKAFPAPKPDASALTPDPSPKGRGENKEEKKDAKKEFPKSEAIEIALELPRARPTGVVAYTGARIVTMKGDEVLERGTLVVDGNHIVAVGATDAVKVPAGASVVDVAGRTIIPGLFDEHAHLHYSALDVLPQRPWKYLANLAYGVTSTHDPSASTHEVFTQSEMVEAGLIPGPRIFSTGYILYGAEDASRAVVKSLDDARKHLRRLKNLGAFSVKSYMQPRRDARQWILQAAREEGMLVVPEGGGDLEMDMTMVLDGHTTLEHALPFAPLRKDVVTLFSKSHTSYTPTLLVAYGGLSGDLWFHQHYDLWKDERLQRYVPQGVVDTLGRIRRVMVGDPADWHHLDVAASAKDILHAGGRICMGGHGQMQGLGPHWELWAFVQAGMTPLEALRVGTLAPAQTLGVDKELGSLEPGKLADFVVLEKNPLENIENSTSIQLVVKNGRAWKPEELERKSGAGGGPARAESDVD
jgi:Tol biopolymer transport system component/imidazolonepropionase-like amidohydrolase